MHKTNISEKKRKKKNKQIAQTKESIQKTKVSRNEISANWKAFLAMQTKNKDAVQKDNIQKTEKYTGPFRRIRKLENLLQTNELTKATSIAHNIPSATEETTIEKSDDKKSQHLVKQAFIQFYLHFLYYL